MFLEGASGEPLIAEPSLARVGASAGRRCRDVPWLLIFLAYWAGMAAVASSVAHIGEPMRLLEGMDDDNNLCGATGGAFEARPYVYFACLQYGHRRPTICMSACPALSGHYVRWYNGSIITCDAHGRSIPATTYPTTHLRFACVPSAATLYGLVAAIIDVDAFTSVVTGILLAWDTVLVACACAALLALMWVLSVRWLAERTLLAPVTIACCLIGLAALTLTMWARALYLTSDSFAEEMPVLQGSLQVAMNTDMSLALALLSTAFAIGVVIALWCGLFHRLMHAGGILRESAEAIRSMPSLLLLLPLFLLTCFVCLLAYWLVISVLIASAGHPSHGHVRFSCKLFWVFVYHTIGFLWTTEVVLHCGFCTAAGAVAHWYFASAEDLPRRYRCRSVPQAVLRALRYSTGSFAVGALVLIPGRVFRFFLEHCLHQAQTDGRGKPELRSVANCCLRCCLDVTTRYIQYISHNAYIYVAVHDLSFAEGAKQAFDLTLRNIGRVSVLTAGERLLLTIAKLAVSCVCTAGAAITMSIQPGIEKNTWSPLDNANGALLITFVATFCVAVRSGRNQEACRVPCLAHHT